MYHDELISRPKILSQRTVGEEGDNTIDKLTMRVNARTQIRAKTKARRHLRLKEPAVKNVLNPSIKGTQETEQSNLDQFFPDSLEMQEFIVELLIVK